MSDPAAFDNLRFELREGVAVVTVARPKALNALNDRTLDELERAFARVREDAAIGGAVVTGDGEKAFAAGADISELARMTPEQASAASAKGQRVFASIEGCGKPVAADEFIEAIKRLGLFLAIVQAPREDDQPGGEARP